MRRPAPLPPQLQGRPFTPALARLAGIDPERLRRSDLDAPFYGVRAAITTNLEQLCAAYATRMPAHQFFCNITAAQLLGLRFPLSPLDRGLHVGTRSRSPRADGVRGHQLPESTPVIELASGLRVSSPVDTWCQLAGRMRFDDVVAMGDGLVERQDPVATLAQLHSAVERWKNRPGAPLLRSALPDIRPLTDSARETRLRLMLMRAGFPEPQVNPAILDRRGAFIGYGDLVYADRMVLVEYDGGHHRGEQQYHADIERLDRFMQVGWRVIRVNKDLMSRPADLFAKVRQALAH